MAKASGETRFPAHTRVWEDRRFLRSLAPWLLCMPALLFVGCAKTGEPHPPVILVARPAVDLKSIQYSDQVLLTVSMPTENTDGSPIASLAAIQVLRCTASDPAPIPESDFLKDATVIASVSGDRIGDYLHDKTLRFQDELKFPDRSVIYREGFRYAVRFYNRKKQSAGLSNQVFIAPVPIPPPPKDLSAQVTQQAIMVRWSAPTENVDGSQPPGIAGYKVYRTEDRKNFPPTSLNSELLQKPEYEDRTFQFDKTYFYEVSVIASRENPYAESFTSSALEVNARDIFPPGAPQNLNGVQAEGAVLLLWGSPADPDVAGYRVYRKEEGSVAFQRLNTGLVTVLSYRDAAVQAGGKYIYRVTAVDTHGNEGPPAESTIEIR